MDGIENSNQHQAQQHSRQCMFAEKSRRFFTVTDRDESLAEVTHKPGKQNHRDEARQPHFEHARGHHEDLHRQGQRDHGRQQQNERVEFFNPPPYLVDSRGRGLPLQYRPASPAGDRVENQATRQRA